MSHSAPGTGGSTNAVDRPLPAGGSAGLGSPTSRRRRQSEPRGASGDMTVAERDIQQHADLNRFKAGTAPAEVRPPREIMRSSVRNAVTVDAIRTGKPDSDRFEVSWLHYGDQVRSNAVDVAVNNAVTRRVVPVLRATRSGRIINVTSSIEMQAMSARAPMWPRRAESLL